MRIPSVHCVISACLATLGASTAMAAPTDPVAPAPFPVSIDAGGEDFIDNMVRRSVLESLDGLHRGMLEDIAEHRVANGPALASMCFAPGTPGHVVEAFQAAQGGLNRFQLIGRWGTTATNGSGLTQGQPTTLTYGFPPDGTVIPNIGVGFPGGINDFNAWMNGIYGSQAVWQPLFDDAFQRWGDLCGVTYIFEAADDGADLHNNGGLRGLRADLRIAGMFLDGNSNVLAYNNFPDDGDMVFDTADNFYNDLSFNSIRLRNVIWHEHGHGMGLLHVCPINGSKLMEPFINTGFEGPQHDDIRASQRHYGDPFEPDNTPAQATDLGVVTTFSPISIGSTPTPVIPNSSILSIDANSEVDFFRFTVGSTALVTVNATPVGLNYDDSAQACGGAAGACCSGDFTNSVNIADLTIQLVDTDGSTQLAFIDAAPIGSAEILSGAVLPSAGDYYVRIGEGNAPGESQLYTLSISVESVPLTIDLPLGAPSSLDPGVAATFPVTITPGTETVTGIPSLFYRFDGGTFLTNPLTSLGGNNYEATIPAGNCGENAEFYVQVSGSLGSSVTSPPNGPGNPFAAPVGQISIVAQDNFEADLGWTVANLPDGGGTFDGGWERGVPVGNDRGDPDVDFDGSGNCYLTDNNPGNSNSDVDAGESVLTSPIYDISSTQNPQVSYARWYSNDTGASPEADVFIVEVSDNAGGSWVNLETVGPASNSPIGDVSGGWIFVSHNIESFVSLTSQFQIRFRVSDFSVDGSVVEAGVDAILVDGADCSAPTGGCCLADFTCTIETNADCITAGGTYFGNGSDCSACIEPTGGCCLADFTCTVETAAACAIAGGTYFGDDTDCSACEAPPAGTIELRLVVADEEGLTPNSLDDGPASISDNVAGIDLYVQARIVGDPDATGLTTFDGVMSDSGPNGDFVATLLTNTEAIGAPVPGDDFQGRTGMFPSYRATIGPNNGDLGNGNPFDDTLLILPLNIDATGNMEGINGDWANVYKVNWSSPDATARTVTLTIDAVFGGYQSTGGLVEPVPITPSTFELTIGDSGCPCEFGGDAGTIDVQDLLAFLAEWFVQDGTSVPAGTGADFNGSGDVDIVDLLDFLSCWFPASSGTCP